MIPALVLAQYAGTLDLLDTTRLNLRRTDPPTIIRNGTAEIALAADLSTAPAANLTVHTYQLELDLTYSPTFTAADVELGLFDQAQFYQAGTIAVAWRDRFVRLRLWEGATYGRVNSGLLYSTPTPTAQPGQPTPIGVQTAPTTIEILSTDTEATAAVDVGPRTTVSTGVGYTLSGGADQASKATLPQQEGAHATLSLTAALSRPDAVTLNASAIQLNTYGPCAPSLVGEAPTGAFCSIDADVLSGQLSLQHMVSEGTTLTVAVGGAGTVESPTTEEVLVGDPTAALTLTQSLANKGRSSLSLSFVLSPNVDLRTGIPSERGQLTAVLANQISPDLKLTFSAGAVQSFAWLTTDPSADPYWVTGVNGSVQADFQLDRLVLASLGETTAWQTQRGFGTFFTSIGFLSVTVRAPELHF